MVCFFREDRIVTTLASQTRLRPLTHFVPILCWACLWFTVGCGTPKEEPGKEKPKDLPTVEAETITIQPETWPTMVRSHGSLVPDEMAVVGSRIEGRVATVHVDLGDRVTTGTPLVTLAHEEFRLRVQQAEAQLLQARSAVGLKPGDPVSQLNPENAPPVLEQAAVWNEARAKLERAKMLQERNSITPSELEQIAATAAVSEARYKSALNGVQEKIAEIGVREAELSLAKEQLADTVIVAPFDGFVQRKEVSAGTYVRIGDPVVTIVRTDTLRFRGTIPERYSLELAIGQCVQLHAESVKDPITVPITRISPAVDLTTRSLLYEAVIDNRDGHLRSGLFAEARIVTDEKATAIVIPQSALVEFAGAEKVWKVVNGESREQQVLTGDRRTEGVQILKGLSEGDVILLDGQAGTVARIVPKPDSKEISNDTISLMNADAPADLVAENVDGPEPDPDSEAADDRGAVAVTEPSNPIDEKTVPSQPEPGLAE